MNIANDQEEIEAPADSSASAKKTVKKAKPKAEKKEAEKDEKTKDSKASK